jgi:tripartite-type tricarboxylate transporter receptor subunit TctC
MPDIADRIAAQGAAPRMGTPEQTRAFIRSELAKWEKVIAAVGIRPE